MKSVVEDIAQTALKETVQYRKAMGFCEYVRLERQMGIMVGCVGSGKTTVLRKFAAWSAGSHYIQCMPAMPTGALLWQIARAAGITVNGTRYHRTQQIAHTLSRRDDLVLLFDDAAQLCRGNPSGLQTLNRLWDETKTPMIFADTPDIRRYAQSIRPEVLVYEFDISLRGCKERTPTHSMLCERRD